MTAPSSWLDQLASAVTGTGPIDVTNNVVSIDAATENDPGSMSANDKKKANHSVDVVADFEAVGDGVADDSTALQEAIDSLLSTGGTVRIPRGYNIRCESTIAMRSNVHVVGDGPSSVVSFTAPRAFRCSGVERCAIRGLKIDGIDPEEISIAVAIDYGSSYVTVAHNYIVNVGEWGVVVADGYTTTTVTGSASGAGGAVKLTVGSTTGFTTGDIVNVRSVGGTTEANGSWTITVNDATHLTLQGSTFANAWTSGGTVEQVNGGAGGIQILNNTFDMRGVLLAGFPQAIEVFPKGGSGYLADPGILIDGNVIIGEPGQIFNAIKCSSQLGARIVNNHIRDITTSGAAGVVVATSRDAIIANNHIDGCQIGIIHGGLPGNRDNLLQQTGVVIANNVIDNFEEVGILASFGCEGVQVLGNQVRVGEGAGTIGIDLANGASIDVTGTANVGGAVALDFDPDFEWCLVDGMRVLVAAVGGTTEANGEWVLERLSATRVKLVGSTFSSAWTSGGTITLIYTGAIISNNALFGAGITVVPKSPTVKVTGNYIADAVGNAALLTGDDAIFRDNVCVRSQFSAVHVVGDRAHVCGNKVIDANVDDAADQACVQVEGDDWLIAQNDFVNGSDGHAKYGIYLNVGERVRLRDNAFVGMETSEVFSAPPADGQPRGQEVLVDNGNPDTAPADTNENTLKSFTLPASHLNAFGGINISAHGITSGAGGTKILRLKFGATSIIARVIPTGSVTWFFEAKVFNAAGEGTQRYIVRYYENGVLIAGSSTAGSFTETTSADVDVEVTVEKADASDTARQDMFTIEVLA